MADKKTSDLDPAGSFLADQGFEVARGGANFELLGSQIASAWGLDYLGSSVLGVAAHETANLPFTWPPGSGQATTRDFLWGFIRVASYGGTPDATGDIASLRFNADSGPNYWSRHIYYDAGTWFDVPFTSASVVRLAPTNSRLSRNVFVTINNLATRGKTVNIKNQTGTADATVLGVINIGGAEWVNLTEQITSAQLINAGSNNFGAGSGMIWFGRNF